MVLNKMVNVWKTVTYQIVRNVMKKDNVQFVMMDILIMMILKNVQNNAIMLNFVLNAMRIMLAYNVKIHCNGKVN